MWVGVVVPLYLVVRFLAVAVSDVDVAHALYRYAVFCVDRVSIFVRLGSQQVNENSKMVCLRRVGFVFWVTS